MALSLSGSSTEDTLTTTSDTKTISGITASADSKRLLTVSIAWATTSGVSRTTSTVTYNGIALTKAVEITNTTGENTGAAIWYLLDANYPSAGSYDVVVTWSDTLSNPLAHITVQQYQDVNQSSLSNSFTNNPDNSTTFSLTASGLSTARNSFVIDCVAANQGSTVTQDSPQVLLESATGTVGVNTAFMGSSYEDAGTSSSVDLGWSGAASACDWSGVGLELIDDSPQIITPTGFNSAGAFGSSSHNKTHTASGFNTAVTLGTPSLLDLTILDVLGFNTPSAFGSPTFRKFITPSGFNTSTNFGTLTTVKFLNPTGLNTPLGFGTPTLVFVWNRVGDSTATFTKDPDPTATFTRIDS